jgi:hypothetical protein
MNRSLSKAKSPHTRPFQACVPQTQTVAGDYLACMMSVMDTVFLHLSPETNSAMDQTLVLLFLQGILKGKNKLLAPYYKTYSYALSKNLPIKMLITTKPATTFILIHHSQTV